MQPGARYALALHADTLLAVFGDHPGAVIEGWKNLPRALAAHLQAHDFTWDEPLRCFHRFYFGPDGHIDTVLYSLRDVAPERVGHHLDAFARTYTFPLSADQGFSQCSPAVLMPPTSEE